MGVLTSGTRLPQAHATRHAPVGVNYLLKYTGGAVVRVQRDERGGKTCRMCWKATWTFRTLRP